MTNHGVGTNGGCLKCRGNTPERGIEEFFTEQDEHGYSVDTAASGGDLNNKEYVRDYLTPKLHKLLHQELQKKDARIKELEDELEDMILEAKEEYDT